MKRESSYISNFRTIVCIVVFIACMIGVYSAVEEKYAKAAEKNTINAFTKSRYDGFYDQAENSIDMVFIGSSHAYCTFDPENFDGNLGKSSWQLGTPLQHPDTSYYSLLEVYKTQKPKLVVVEVYWDMLNEAFEMKQANSFFEVVKDEKVKKDYIKDVFPFNEKVKYNILPIRYQQDYFAYEGAEMERNIEEKYKVHKKKVETQAGTEKYASKGYVYCDYVLTEAEYDETNQFKGVDGKKWVFDDTQKEWLLKIIDLCSKNNSEVVFVTAPIANVSMEYISNYDKIHDTINAFAEENNIKYVDYNIINREENLLKNDNFRDDAHLNDGGVKIVDRHFLEWIMNNTNIAGQ